MRLVKKEGTNDMGIIPSYFLLAFPLPANNCGPCICQRLVAKIKVMLSELGLKKVSPCELKVVPLSRRQIQQLISGLKKGWHISCNQQLRGEFEFTDFMEAMIFVNDVAAIAEEAECYPEICVKNNMVKVALKSEDIGALAHEDFDMARLIERLV